MLVRVECLGFQIQAARCYTISQAKREKWHGSPSNQASDQPIPTIAVTAIKARSIGLQDQVGREEQNLTGLAATKLTVSKMATASALCYDLVRN